MKKKIFAVILSVIMIIAAVQPVMSVFAVSSVWNGGTAMPALSGGYYQINTAEKLAWFANQVNSGSPFIKAKLTDDIMLNYSGGRTNQWTPIGSEEHPFKGEFDGGGHYISGVYISTAREYSGLFGYVYTQMPVVDDEDDTTEEIFTANPPVMIHDLTVKDASIAGLDNTGGIAGYIHYGIIKECSFSGTVTATGNSVGGICGYAFNFSRVTQCSSSGSVTGNIRTGGIVGYAYANAQINECYSTCTVRSNANVNGNSGGIIGAFSYSTLKGCYFMGSVAGPKNIGGIVGYNSYSTIVSCYVIGGISSTIGNEDTVHAIAGYTLGCQYYNCYYCADSTVVEDTNGVARTVDDMKKFSFVRELNENASAFSFDYMAINNGLPVLVFMLETSVWAGGVDEPQQDSSGWYIIKTPDNLAWFAKLVNGTLAGVERNSAAKARVMENLLFNIFITEDTSLTNEWIPIGTEAYPFTGTFNANGYNIAGIYVNGTKNQGLFGYVGAEGNISNVVMLDGSINGTENVGAVAGYNKGKITNSCNCGAVNGQKAIGGIAGYNTGTIQDCYNIGTVKCPYENGSQVGGIVGYNTRAKVDRCFNDGFVTGVANTSHYGGIAGYNAGDGIYNSYNSGEVLGGFNVGGIIGYNSTGTVKYCLNFGVVNSLNLTNSNANCFIGLNNGTATVTNCYIDSTIENSVINNLNGAVAKTTDELTGSSASYSLGLQSGSWTNRYDDEFFKYYPQINQIYYSSIQKAREDSLESVKAVKSEYNVKLKIDGATDTYFADLQSAVTALGYKSGSIVPVRNITVSSTVNIATNAVIRGEGFAKTITRAEGFTGTLFNVTGTLTLGDVKDGSDENILLIIDGNTNVIADSSIITLAPGGNAVIYPGVEITGGNSEAQGSAVYMDMDSTLTMRGGKIMNCQTTLEGGAIFNDMGTLNIYGGEISGNKSTVKPAGGIYNNDGILNISGGVIRDNYGKTYGGGIYNTGDESEVTISGSALIKDNYANAGGGVYINKGTVTMTGGEINHNFVYKKHGTSATAGGGGGVTINSNGTFIMSGGTVCNNYTYQNVGNGFGIAIFGTFEMSGNAVLTNNDILVAKNRSICLTDKLNCAGTAAVITPANYATTTKVLSGDAMGLNYSKFEVTPTATETWYVNSAGYLMNTPVRNVASLSKFGAYTVDYVSVAQAVNAVAAGESGIITIIADNTINETIKVYGDVTILSETDQTYTSMRGGSFTGTMFEVQAGGTLRLGYSDEKIWGEDISTDSEEEATFTLDSVGGQYILDGGYAYNGSQGTSMITVKSGGKLYTYDDFTMQNGKSTMNGNITVSGNMYMYGGTLQNNIGVNGGAINVATTGTVELLGGTVTGNTVGTTGLGGAIYSAGTLKRAKNIYEYIQDDATVATQNTYTTVTQDNDIYLTSGKTLVLENKITEVLLSGTSSAPESSSTAANTMILSAPAYYAGMPMLSGEDVGIHYSEFEVSEQGYYITPDGTIGYNRLIPKTDSELTINRAVNFITGIDTSSTVGVFRTLFLNSEPVTVKDINGNLLPDSAKMTTGCTVCLGGADGYPVIDSVTAVIIGDVDCDGYIDAMDSILISCIAQELYEGGDLTAAQLRAADVDASGTWDDADAQYIQSCGLLINTVDQHI